ncbi:MAG: hypothetical protein RI907_170 [Pseudomonadota bacterium]
MSEPLKSTVDSQRGVALIVVLLFMAALGVGGLYSARSALLGERMARNQLDNQVARQAAEAALRDAEVDLAIPDSVTRAGATCSRGESRPVSQGFAYFTVSCDRGQCDPGQSMADRLNLDYSKAGVVAGAKGAAWWPTAKGGKWGDNDGDIDCASFTGAVPLGTYTGASKIPGVARQPEYLIEQFRKDSKTGDIYRITARGFGYRTGTEVVMQSYFQVPAL